MSPQPAASGADSHARRLDIQGLRAIAVLMVVAYHAGIPLPGGFIGVDVFFVISGFVITALLRRELTSRGSVDFRQFYLRRFKRLTPALALMIAATMLSAALLLSPLGTQAAAAKTAVGAMLLSANLVLARTTGGYFDAPAETNPLLHCWSLSVEEQFYLIFPAIVAVGWRIATKANRRFSPSRFAATLIAAASSVSLACALLGAQGLRFHGAQHLVGFYSPVSRTWEFGVGALLVLLGFGERPPSVQRAALMGAGGAALLAASTLVINASTPFPGPPTLVPVAGTALLLVAGANATNGVTRTLSASWLVKIGDWSYSLYLWHWPLIVFASIMWPGSVQAKGVAATLSLLPALASYYWLEQPMRSLKLTGARRVSVALTLATVPPLLLAGLLLVGTHAALQTTIVKRAVDATSARHAPSDRGCMTRGPFGAQLNAKCWWNGEATGAPLYLVGDSNAWQFAEGVIDAAKSLGRPVWILTTPSCPLVSGVAISATGRSPYFLGPWPPFGFAHCTAYIQQTLGFLSQAKKGEVVVAGLDQYWWDPTLQVSLDGSPTTNVTEKVAFFREGLARSVGRIRAAGHDVLLVQTLPTFRNPAPPWDPRACSAVSVFTAQCFRETSVADIEGYQRPSRVAISDVAALTGARVLDLRAWFCRNRRCGTHRDGAWLYADATHVTVATSHALTSEFLRALHPSLGRD